MTWNRFEQYAKTILGGAFIAHMLISILFIELIGGRGDLIEHRGGVTPLGIAILMTGALWGFVVAWRSPAPPPREPRKMVECPTCGSWVDEKRIDATSSAQ